MSGRGALTAVIVVAATVIVAAGLSIVLGGGGISSVAPSTTPTAAPSALASALAAATPSPTDFPPVATPAATGSAGSPSAGPGTSAAPSPAAEAGIVARRIQIPRLGIDLKIIEGDGIDAPIGKAAHYPGTAWPDGGSNIYIYGHARTGMFLSLWDAKVGDKVVLTLADGTERTYLVDKVLPKVPYDATEYLQPTATEQLTLQTSTSYYETAPRFVVIAHPGP